MKKLFFLFLSTVILTHSNAQELRTLKETAFKRGEVLNYRIHYGFIDAATASIEVKNENTLIGGRSTFHIVGIGVTKSSFDWFFKVRDRYETYLDEQALVPWLFIRRVNEGGYIINQNMVFNQIKHTVNSNGKIFNVIPNIQDMLSSFYYARCFDFSNAKKGDLFDVPSFVDNKLFNLQIKFIKRETIKTDFGKIKCLVFVPVLQTGRIFKNEEDMKVWITDDDNHIPIRAEAQILVGSIKMDLQSYSGLANPILFK